MNYGKRPTKQSKDGMRRDRRGFKKIYAKFDSLREVDREVNERLATEPRKTYLEYLEESQDAQQSKQEKQAA
jgi:hypothetical protein